MTQLETATKYVAIVGSRTFSDRKAVEAYVKQLPNNVVVVSGGAKGVDTWAALAAQKHGLKVKIFLPDWEQYGRAAGFIRNQDIVDLAHKVVAFWDGESRGTAHSMRLAKDKNKPLTVIKVETPENA